MLALTSSFLHSLRPILTSISLVSRAEEEPTVGNASQGCCGGLCEAHWKQKQWQATLADVQPSIVRDLPTILWDETCQSPRLGNITQLIDCLPSTVRIPA